MGFACKEKDCAGNAGLFGLCPKHLAEGDGGLLGGLGGANTKSIPKPSPKPHPTLQSDNKENNRL